jgi:hypothetical protein
MRVEEIPLYRAGFSARPTPVARHLKPINHEVHEEHEEKQELALPMQFTRRVRRQGPRLSFFVAFVLFVVQLFFPG